MLRFLMRYLANSDRLVSRLAESRPIRRAAQFVVYVLTRTSAISGTHQLPSNPKEFATHLANLAKKFADGMKKNITNVKDEVKKK